jgi:hypothetical protein
MTSPKAAKNLIMALPYAFAVTLLIGCTPGGNSGTKEPLHMDILATHAFDTPVKVSSFSTIANDVAPWLGRIIVLGTDGSLYSTNIEGRDFKQVAKKGFRNVAELPRTKSAGMFLAISDLGSLAAFVESDDEGNFKQLTYSGESLEPVAFCEMSQQETNQSTVLTKDGQIHTLSFSLSGNVVEQTITQSTQAPQNTIGCFVENNEIYALTHQKDKHHIRTLKGAKWTSYRLPDNILSIAPIPSKQSVLFLAITQSGFALFDQEKNSPDMNIRIMDGLSIRGLEMAENIQTTQINYGGAAFNKGMITLSDAHDNRLVFISLEYFKRQFEMTAENSETQE